jgi:hypothetical protein
VGSEHRAKLAVGVERLEFGEAADGGATEENDGEGRGCKESVEDGSDDFLVGWQGERKDARLSIRSLMGVSMDDRGCLTSSINVDQGDFQDSIVLLQELHNLPRPNIALAPKHHQLALVLPDLLSESEHLLGSIRGGEVEIEDPVGEERGGGRGVGPIEGERAMRG